MKTLLLLEKMAIHTAIHTGHFAENYGWGYKMGDKNHKLRIILPIWYHITKI